MKINANKLRSLLIIFLLVMSPVISAQEMSPEPTVILDQPESEAEITDETQDEPEITDNSLLIYDISSIEPKLLYVVSTGRDPRHAAAR